VANNETFIGAYFSYRGFVKLFFVIADTLMDQYLARGVYKYIVKDKFSC